MSASEIFIMGRRPCRAKRDSSVQDDSEGFGEPVSRLMLERSVSTLRAVTELAESRSSSSAYKRVTKAQTGSPILHNMYMCLCVLEAAC